MTYVPKPIDVSKVELAPSLQELQEKLAQNTHEVWAAQRLADGWSYGDERDDHNRRHPCLVAYPELPESEKEYDRKVSESVIKTMLKLGYVITPPGEGSLPENEEPAIIESLAVAGLDIARLRPLWARYERTLWKQYPQLCLLLGSKILKAGEPLLAFDVLTTGLDSLDEAVLLKPDSDQERRLFIQLQQQRALALAQSGAPKTARKILERLQHHDPENTETAGLYGRACKDIAFSETDAAGKRENLQQAFKVYHQAYLAAVAAGDADAAYYNGINAATLSLFLGELKICRELAGEIKTLCLGELGTLAGKNQSAPYWLYATLGEAELLSDNPDAAADWYRQAVQAAGGATRDIASMKRQALAILENKGADTDWLDQCFPLPAVLVFTGHMIDRPGRRKARFPAEMEPQVRAKITAELERVNAGIAYASAACGADIIFLEEMLKRGAEVNVVLPFDQESFVDESVDFLSGTDWRQRFEQVLAKAARVYVLGEKHPEMTNQTHFEFANLFLYGTAAVRSQMLGARFCPLAVWDGQTDGQAGGTAATIRQWCALGATVNFIPLSATIESPALGEPPPPVIDVVDSERDVTHYSYLPMLFADVKGYSQLSEQQVVAFSTHFLELVGQVIAAYDAGVLSRRTQGDGLFLVFRDLTTACRLALDLNRKVKEVDWSGFGLPAELLFRISLDAGPCYAYTDPIVNKLEFCGDYVVRAARMEPITPPGEIYASETFVALTRATSAVNDEIQFDYAGQVSLPKNYGVIPVFHLRE